MDQARSQDLEKGGGSFERVRKVQRNLTRIFIILESVSHGLSEIWDGISQKALKFKRFLRSKTGGLQKKKKVFTEIESDFSAKVGSSNNFSAQKQVVSKTKQKKKGLHRNWVWFLGQNRKFKHFFTTNHDIYITTSAPNFLWGGLFSIFHQKSA